MSIIDDPGAILAALDHDLEPHCEMNYHGTAPRPPATHALMITICGHYDLMCQPCTEATRARARTCQQSYARCAACGEVWIGEADEMLAVKPLPGIDPDDPTTLQEA